ncbi:hypothetical protein GCM10010275_05770 [Streptomyces litmocidini]|uniref:hypothetical protein n=1 Tax=Streptomyces litmocidini TaxID=67318 RepID=UPI00167EC9DA|nr:hypothetical protein [Streptomyces litmocidini]GGU73933.1 hypothetical protein GCM10010275_05770 [Streptomyces litmocidini]
MRTALRTAIATALVAGVAITAPALTAGAAFAADGPATTATPAATAPATGTEKAADTKGRNTQEDGVFVRNQILPNGATARIVKLGDTHYRAEILKEGQRVGTLEADGHPVAGNDDGTFLVLFETGLTSTWQGNYLPGARPGVYELADGTRVELTLKHGGYDLRTVEKNGEGRVLVHLNGTREVGVLGKAVLVVEPDGGFAAHIDGGTRQAAPKPVGASDATPAPEPTPGPVVTLGDCTVQQVVPSVFGEGWEVTLTHDLEKGPKAVLKDDHGKVQGTADRAHPFDGRSGLKIEGADTLAPRFGQRTQGGDTPFHWTAFPKLPKGCEKDTATPAPAPSATTPAPAGNTGTTVNNGGQTSVVPKGGVAAGAELAAEGDSTALIAAGAGAASLAAAGLGFVVLRRRAAGARG